MRIYILFIYSVIIWVGIIVNGVFILGFIKFYWILVREVCYMIYVCVIVLIWIGDVFIYIYIILMVCKFRFVEI